MLDPWPTYLVKNMQIYSYLPSLNWSLVSYQEYFPGDFKKAVVTPLIKKSLLPKNELKNYSPLLGLCIISKLVERSVAVHVKHHIDNNTLGNTLLSIKNDILSTSMPTALVLLDLLAVFDTIDHTGLLNYLSSWFGFSGTVLKWFCSYISGRQLKLVALC